MLKGIGKKNLAQCGTPMGSRVQLYHQANLNFLFKVLLRGNWLDISILDKPAISKSLKIKFDDLEKLISIEFDKIKKTHYT